jgi:O-antigen/teichoic acid export membrane protein
MSVRRALAFAYVEKYGSFVISLMSTMVLSRLLLPAQIGVFSIGMAVVSLVGVVREFGIGTYVIQETELDDNRIRAAFTATLMIGLPLALLVLLVSVPAGSFYADEQVARIIAILSIAFLLTPFGSVAQGLLTRELKFGRLASIRLTHAVVLAGMAVLLAWSGLGAESLAWAAVIATAISTVASMASRPHAMRPIWDGPNLRRVVKVGGTAAAVHLLDEVSASLPEAALGRLQSMTAVGLYSRGRTMSQMAHQVLARAAGPVFLAAFSEIKRNQLPLAPGYLKATACIVGIGWCALAILAVLAEPVVAVLFGANWGEVVTPLRWLCAGAAVALLTSGAHHVLLADGGVGDVLKAKLFALPGHVACVLVGAAISLEGLTIGLLVSSIQSTLLLAWFIRRRLQLGLRQQCSPAVMTMPLVVASSLGAAGGLLVTSGEGALHSLLELALGSLSGFALALLTLILGRHPLRSEAIRLLGRWRHR